MTAPMTPNPAPTVEQIAAMDDKLNVERLRALDAAIRDAKATGPLWKLQAATALQRQYLGDRSAAILAMAEENARLREALGKMRTEAVLLLNNAEGCAANHYGSDFRMLGMPQWLLDARENIASASAPLRALANQERQS